MTEPQPLSDDVAKEGFHHPSEFHPSDWKEWETTVGETELNPVEETND